MNVIFILLDSLNKNYIEPYGNKVVKTPNLQKLADKGVVFENHFLGSAPCMPARRELFSGRKNEFRGYSYDIHLALERHQEYPCDRKQDIYSNQDHQKINDNTVIDYILHYAPTLPKPFPGAIFQPARNCIPVDIS